MFRVLAGVVAVIASGTAVAVAAAPTVTTGTVGGIDYKSATVHGAINPQGEATAYYFEYGTSGSYGSKSTSASAGSGTSNVDISSTLFGLKASTTYHYRAVGTSSQGTTNGADRTFTTAKLPAPGATTEAASNIGETSARLNGNVRPNGQQTTYHFEYGASKAYGLRTAETGGGSGTGTTDVHAGITGLTSGQTYHFRVVATSAGGTTAGADRSFTATPLPRPAVTTSPPDKVRADSARLRGFINAHGQQTTYHFEYGTSRSYGSRTPDASGGHGSSNVAVRAVVGGLAGNTRYHFRLVASGPGGVTNGGDRSFVTPKVPLGLTIAASPNPVVFGRLVSLAGRLTGTGNAGRPVVLQQRAFPFTAAWGTLAGPVSTDAGGAFFFGDIRLGLATQLRVVTADNKVASRPVTVAVAVRVRTHVSRTRVKRHRRVRFSGSFRPAAEGALFAIQKRKRGRWVTVAGGVTHSSRFSRRIRVHRGGRYRVYVRVTGGGVTSGIGRTVRLRTFI